MGGAQDILAGRLTIDISGFTQQVAQAVKEANAQIANIGKGTGGSTNQLSTLKEMQRALKDLSASYKDYNSAVSAGNTSGADFFKQKITSAKELINVIHEVSKLELSNGEISKNTYSEIATQFQKAQSIIQGEAKKTQEAEMKSIEAQKKARQEYIALWERQIKQTDKQNQQAEVNKVTSAYKNLTTAISEYNRARQAGNTEGANYWRQQVESSNQVLQNMKQNVDMSNLEANQREKVNQAIQRGSSAYQNFIAQQSQSVSMTETLAGQFDKMYGKLKLIAGISLVKIFHDALSYAKEFDAAMTDIQIITGQTEAQALTLGEGYRQLASNLQVTSTDIAKTAATIYRQGYTSPKEVQAIIEGATKFGAVTGQTTEKALQSMTATMQNFRKDGMDMVEFVQRIGDTWSYMGDNVATTGEEISVAMDKMAASVNMVGVSFEQASSWAAIMLARTQQSGQVIGTQLNSLVARYAKVTSKGYKAVTSDDAGEALNFNDVSKALRQAGIEIFDAASSKFMEMDVMMDKLASKWDTLDEATQRYIATTLGGTRGMNYLLTLLNNYNDAVELQAKVEEGVMNNKYDAWLESVAAAQNNLTNSMENLYQILSSDVLTNFYNGLAGIVDMISAATNATNGWNIKLPLIITGVLGIVSAFAKLGTVVSSIIGLFSSGGSILGGLGGILSGGHLGLILGGIAAVATAIGGIISLVKTSGPDFGKLINDIQNTMANAERWSSIKSGLTELANTTEWTANETERFNTLRAQIVADSPILQAKYGAEGEGLRTVADALDLVNSKYQEQLEILASQKQLAYENTKKEYLNIMKTQSRSNGVEFSDYALKSDPGIALSTMEDGALNGNLTYTAAKQYQENLKIISDNIDIIGLGLEEQFNDTAKAVDAAIVIAKENIRASLADFMDGLMGAFTMDEINALFNGQDSLFTNLATALLGSEYGIEHSEEALNLAVRLGRTYAQMVSGGINQGLMDEWMTEGFEGMGAGEEFNKMIHGIWENYTNALKTVSAQNNPQLQAAFEEATASWGPAMWEAFNKAISEFDPSTAEDPFFGLQNLIWKWVRAQRDELDSLISDAVGGSGEEPDTTVVDSFTGKLKEATGATNELKSAIEQLKAVNDLSPFDRNLEAEDRMSDEDLLALAKAYPELTDAILAYREAMDANPNSIEAFEAETALLDKLENIQLNEDLFAGMEQIGQMIEAMEMLDSGEYDFEDIQGLLNLFPELMELDPGEWFDYLASKLEETTNRIKENAEALGLSVDKYESFADKVSELVHPISDSEKAIQKLSNGNQLTLKELDTLIKKYPDLSDEIEDYGKDVTQADKLLKALNKDIMEDAVDTWAKSLESALKNLDNAEVGTRDYAAAMKDLASSFDFQGLGTLDNLAFVTQNLDNIRAAANGSADAFRALQEAAWVNIVGTSDADFSAVMNGMALVDAQAVAVGNMLARMGMGTVEYQTLDQVMPVFHYTPDGGLTVTMQHVAGQVAVWKPSAGNPFASAARSGGGKGSSGGGGGGGKKGGGGGGGGSSTIQVSEGIQKMVDDMADVQDKIKHQLKMIDLKKEYYDIRGELQGVIKMTNQESEAIVAQNKVLEENITTLQVEIDKQQDIIAKNKESSTAYKQAAKDLEPLVKAQQEYSQSLAENTNRLEQIQKELKDYDKQLLDMLVDEEEMYRDIIKRREEAKRNELDSMVELQDKILDVLTESYEKQRDMAVEAAEAKKDSLQDEIDKIDELIAAREKLINKEKEEEDIAKLQKKIIQISADPTRRKEMLKLEEELREKQKKLAWDTYKEEMEAQKEGLKKQSDSVDDYIDTIKEKYEELLNNPEKLIEQMKVILEKTDSDITQWFIDNSKEFYGVTEEKKKQLTEDLQDLIDAAHGIVETYQDEVDKVVAMTKEEKIAWMMENDPDYATASKKKQEQYIRQWEETLGKLEDAFRDTATEIIKIEDTFVPRVDGSGGGSGGGGGGGGGSYGGGGGYYGGYDGGSGVSWVNTNSGSGSSSVTSAMDSSGKNAALNKTSGSTGGSGGSNSLFTAMDSGGQAASKATKYTGTAVYKWKKYNSTVSVVKNATSSTNKEQAIKAAENSAKAAAQSAAKSYWADLAKNGTAMQKTAAVARNKQINSGNYMGIAWLEKSYKLGGMADFTGPAWLDGTPSRPERILSAEQTQLFEDLLATLHAIKMVNVSGLSGMNLGDAGTNLSNFIIERIEINLQNLDSDADYELISQRVGQAIMDSIQRTLPIGGIRIS